MHLTFDISVTAETPLIVWTLAKLSNNGTALIKQALVTTFPSGSLPYKKGLDKERSF